jgi:predicted metal-dependent peptidase
MSDGGIGNGLSYCATIKISGELDKKELKALIAEIEKILKPYNGKIESEARVSTTAAFDANFVPIPKS